MTHRATKRYARALFRLSREAGHLEEVRSDMRALGRLLRASPAFRRFLAHPLIPAEQRRRLLREHIAVRLHATTRTFLLLLEEKARLALLGEICDQVEALYDEHAGILRAHLRSAHPLTDAQQEAVSQRLASRFGKEIRLTTEQAPELLGGFSVQTEDKVYDASVASLLQSFRHNLMHA